MARRTTYADAQRRAWPGACAAIEGWDLVRRAQLQSPVPSEFTPAQKAWATRRGRASQSGAVSAPAVAPVVEAAPEGATQPSGGFSSLVDALHEGRRARAAQATAIKPMLASAMRRGTLSDYGTDEWVLEEKYDGHRVLVHKAGDTATAWNRPRAGKDALPRQLAAPIVAALRHLPDGLYDGELVAPGGRSWDVARLDTDKALVLFDVLEVLGEPVTSKPLAQRSSRARRRSQR